jgi:hypothetical protein
MDGVIESALQPGRFIGWNQGACSCLAIVK